jgi:hypothetical protein
MNVFRYVRVTPWGVGSLTTKLPHTEVCGVAELEPFRRVPKLKVNRRWLSWEHNECRFSAITQEEFETDLAFDLWPKLKVKYCPRWVWWLTIRYHNLRGKWVRWQFIQSDIFPWILVALTVIALVVELYILSRV